MSMLSNPKNFNPKLFQCTMYDLRPNLVHVYPTSVALAPDKRLIYRNYSCPMYNEIKKYQYVHVYMLVTVI